VRDVAIAFFFTGLPVNVTLFTLLVSLTGTPNSDVGGGVSIDEISRSCKSGSRTFNSANTVNSCITPGHGITISMLMVCLLTSNASVNADSAVPAWVQRYNSSIGSDDQAYHAAADAGNVVVAGYRNNGFTWNDLVVIKYSNAGVPLWTNLYGGPENFASEVNALAVDSDGNVFLGGFSRIGGSIDYLVLKYSHAGVPLWTNYYDGAAHGTDRIWDLAVDSAGDVIVTGSSLESPGYADCVTIKYSGAGNPMWTNRYNGVANLYDSGFSLVLDGAGNVIVAGGTETGVGSSDFLIIKYTSSGVPIWTNVSGLSSFSGDYARSIAVDGADNVLMLGSSRPPVYGAPFTYSIIKYSTAGAALWTNRFNGPGSLFPRLALHPNGSMLVSASVTNASSGGYDFFLTAISDTGVTLWSTPCEGIGVIACAVDGQIFTAGGNGHATTAYSSDGMPLWTNRFFGSMGSGGFAVALALAGNDQVVAVGATYNAESYYDFTTIAYSGSGTALWTNWYDGGAGNYPDVAQALAVGVDGSVVVTGSSRRVVGENDDYTTIKYAATGQPLWTNWFSAPASSTDRPIAIALDGAGDVIVTGQTIATNLAGTSLFATVKISATGTSIWSNFYRFIPSGGGHVPQAVAVDGENNVYVTGYSHGGSSYYDFATIKYSATGLGLWTNRYNTPLNNSDDRPAGMVVDDSGTIYVTGYGPSTFGGTDFITLAYSNNGVALWTNRYHLVGADNRAVDVAADATGNIFVTGYSKLSGQTTYDFATIKYASDGMALWTNRYNGPAEDRPVALATDPEGNVIVTGYSSNNATGFDIATIKYSGAGSPVWTNRFDGLRHSENRPAAVVVDPTGNIIVTGFARSGSALATTDFVTIKYSSAGSLMWTATYNGPANGYDSPMSKSCLGVGPDGSVYVTGASDGSFAATRIDDFVTIKYVEISPVQLTVVPSANGLFTFSFTNKPNAPFSVLTATNAEAVSTEWTVRGGVIETTPGHFNFTDAQPTTNRQRFYRVRSP
jgi:uncharacterized delta-60 repeat protein